MEPKCGVCHDRVAAFRCIQCHKPVCDECSFKDDNGAFCGRDCAGAYRSYKTASASAKAGGRGGAGTLIVLIIVLAAAAVAAGLKKDKISDLGFIFSEKEAEAAGVFTTNNVMAAPVLLSR